ncbi:MAG: hypothetical protein P8R37_12455 [Opitutae bacterium]|nr:hypothetical protein [Opitutae bacterium]
MKLHPNLAKEIRVGIAQANHAGYVVRNKTADEIRKDCQAFDLKYKVQPYATKSKRAVGRGKAYSDEQRIKLITAVHGHLEAGERTKDACDKAGVGYKVYMGWRTRLNITEPALRSYQKKAGA